MKTKTKTCAQAEAARAAAFESIVPLRYLEKFRTLRDADRALQELIAYWREESTTLRQAEHVLMSRGAKDVALRVQYIADAIDQVSQSLEEWGDIPF